MDGYSIGLVQNLYKAGRDQDRTEHIEFVTGVSIGVTDAIDLTLGKGKAKVLQEYTKEILKTMKKEQEQIEDKPKGVKVSKSVMALFNSLPRVERTEEEDESG